MQTIRQPVFAVIMLVSIAFIVITLPLVTGIMDPNSDSDEKMLESFSISTLLVAGFLLAAFSAAWIITREIEDKTALTVVSKPVARATFVLGRFVGMSLAIAAAYYICSLAALIIIRHGALPAAYMPYDFPVIVIGTSALLLTLILAGIGNYAFGWSFPSACTLIGIILLTIAAIVIAFVGKGWKIVEFGHGIRPQLLVAIFMSFLAVIVITAIATLASTRLGQIMTLCVSMGAIVAGSMHDYIFGGLSDRFVTLQVIGWLVPNLTYFYATDALMIDVNISGSYVGMCCIYAACYCAAALACAIGLFQTRQLDADEGSVQMPAPIGIVAVLGRFFAAIVVLLGIEAGVGKIAMSAGWTVTGFTPVVANTVCQAIGLGVPGVALALAATVAMGIVGVITWYIFGCFARGQKWSYAVVMTTLLGCGIYSGVTAYFTGSATMATNGTFAAVAFGTLVLLLILPGSIKHFRSQSQHSMS